MPSPDVTGWKDIEAAFTARPEVKAFPLDGRLCIRDNDFSITMDWAHASDPEAWRSALWSLDYARRGGCDIEDRIAVAGHA